MKTKRGKKSEPEGRTDASSIPIPDPAALRKAAEEETRVIAARDYIDTINILRDKKSFSFREIAAWFNERGVPLDNNDVYRAYMGDMDADNKAALEHYKKEIDPED